MRLKKFLTLIIMAVAMILAIPLTASAYTSETVDGFYLSGNYATTNGTGIKYMYIYYVHVSGNTAKVGIKMQFRNTREYDITQTVNNFSCLEESTSSVTINQIGGFTYSRYTVTFHHIPGHIVTEYNTNENTHYGTCKFCGDFADNHHYDYDCVTTCDVCGYVRQTAVQHNCNEATCLLPEICKVCGGTSGEALNHNFENGYCTACNTEEQSGIVHIKTAEQLKLFAYNVNNGKTNISAVLDDDIDMSEFNDFHIGTSNNAYSGTFDGNGHKITINLNGGQYSAPFSYTNGANIKNLTTDGSITTGEKFAAGIVGSASGNTKLENCLSFVTINSSVDGDATHGGLVANAAGGILTMDNCAFLGTIKGENTQNCGGLVGWATVSTKINNSYVAAEFSINTKGSSNTIARNPGRVTLTNCYYVNELGSTPSKTTQVTKEQIESGELAFLLNGVSGGEKWYQNIDNGNVDKYPVPNSAHGTIYYGYADCSAETAKLTNTYTKKSIQGHNGGTATCISAGYCVDCGEKYLEKNPAAHETNETYYRYINNEKHGEYHSCCKVLINEEKHNVKEATCTDVNYCDICKSYYGSKNKENHKGEQKWVDTGYGEHEYKYTCCGVVTETEAHNLEYSVDDETDTIDVKCAVCADKSTNKWNSGHGTVTLSVEDELTYDGNAVEAGYTATGFMQYWGRPVDISFKYHCEGGCKNVGEHWVEMTVGDKTVKKTFTIEKRELKISEIIAENKEYDATNAVTLNTINLDNVVIYQKGEYAAFDIKDSVELDLSKVIVTTTDTKPGNYTTANVTGITLIGSDKDNYTIAESMNDVKIRCSNWYSYDITRAQVYIVANDQILEGDAELDQTEYTVEFADEKFEIWGIGLKEDEDNKGKISVDTENVKITYNGDDVTDNFYFSIKGANLSRVCEGHTFNKDGFCSTGKCNTYQSAVLITKENCGDYGFEEYEIYENEPKYAIYNVGQLYWFADRVNNYNENDICGVLADDIIVNKDLTAEDLKEWSPIGKNSMMAYCGNFYGNGHTISGLYCKSTEDGSYVGFFGSLGYYTIDNLHIANSYFEGSYAGGIAGYSGGATIEKCSVADDVTVIGTSNTGGIVGSANGTVENCYSLANVSGGTWGGLVGDNSAAVKNSYTTAMKSVGYNNDSYGGSVTNCYYFAEADDVEGGKTAEQFANGEVAYLLQNGVDEIPEEGHWDDDYVNWTVDVPAYIPQIWGQNIGTDKYPTFSNDIVYEDTYNNINVYRNEIDGNKILLLGTDKKSATIVLDKAGTYTMVLADYEDNRLANVETFEVTVDKAQAVRVISTKDLTLGTNDKIMLWNNFENLTPMCKVYEVK